MAPQPGLNINSVALQIEKVRPEVPILYQQDDTLLGLIEDRTDGLQAVSTRTYRAPVNIQQGGNLKQINPDGGPFGRGSAFKTEALLLNQVYLGYVVEYSAQAKIATDSKEKAVENYVAQLNENEMKMFRTGIESIVAFGDGSGTLDSITSVANSPVLAVNNANGFQDQQVVQVFPSLTAASRGSMQIMMVDSIANTITIDPSTPVPLGTQAGDLLIIDGAAGVANSSLNGLVALQLNSNVGSYLGVQRAAYPGRLSCPLIAGASAPITPQRARLMLNQSRLALGVDTPENAKYFWYMTLDQEAQIENIGLIVTQVIQNQLKGDSSQDMLMKTAPKTFAGRPIKASIHGIPGRIDGIAAKHWFRAQIQALDYYDVNGQTIFPAYASDGSIETLFLVNWWIGFQIGNDNPRAGVYSTANAIPSGYYGH
jgi:hypothetical protein